MLPKGFICLPWVAITCLRLQLAPSTKVHGTQGDMCRWIRCPPRRPAAHTRGAAPCYNLLPGAHTWKPIGHIAQPLVKPTVTPQLWFVHAALASPQCQTCQGSCSEVCAPGGRPEMADKACWHGSDSPGLTWSISIPRSATENSCIIHLAMNNCKTQLTLSVLVSWDSLWP